MMNKRLFLERKSSAHSLEAVSAINIDKSIGVKKVVQSLNLQIFRGELFGLIGPDGAGKTSFMRLLSGAISPDAGELRVFGKKPVQARAQIGYMTQHFSLYPELSVIENLWYLAALRGLSEEVISSQQEKLLNKVGLLQYSDRLAAHLSGGMKQKLAFCAALIGNPDLLLLDEPCTGVDPLSRLEFWEMLNDVRQETAACIVLATPYCAEAEQCDRVAFLQEGRLEFCDTPYHLKSRFALKRIELQSTDNERAMLLLAKGTEYGECLYEDLQVCGDRIQILVRNSGRIVCSIKELLAESLIQIIDLRVCELSMNNVFFLHMAEGRQKDHEPAFDLLSKARGMGTVPGRECAQSAKASGTAAICAAHLSKVFEAFAAVKDFSLEIPYGEVYGLLGANGAGKTTAIKMLCGLHPASSGDVQICGKAGVNLRKGELRRLIGYMSQKNSLYQDLTVAENLDFFASVYELSSARKRQAIALVTRLFSLAQCKNMLVGSLPSGLRQRVAFAGAIMHQPQVLFLDEPGAGADPPAQRALWNIIQELARQGTAILVSTHLLDEAENCNRIGMMLAGELIAEGSPSKVKAEARATNLEEAFLRILSKNKGGAT